MKRFEELKRENNYNAGFVDGEISSLKHNIKLLELQLKERIKIKE